MPLSSNIKITFVKTTISVIIKTDFLKAIKQINPDFKIFLDLKLYDIPNTMADAAESIMGLGVDMFNVHASAGKRAMTTVMERLKKYDNRPIVLAVTALTSFSEDEFECIKNFFQL